MGKPKNLAYLEPLIDQMNERLRKEGEKITAIQRWEQIAESERMLELPDDIDLPVERGSHLVPCRKREQF